MTGSLFLQLFANTLLIGGVYVLFAIGLTLIFGVMKIINFAHGVFFSTSALVVSVVSETLARRWGWPGGLTFVVSLSAGTAVVLLLGAGMFWFGFQKVLRDLIGSFILSVGLLLLLQGVLLTAFTGAPRTTPALVEGSARLFGVAIDYQRLIVFAVAVSATGALYAFLQRSRLGWALRAVAEDPEAAMLQGINFRRVSLQGFLIGSLLAGLAGGLIAPLTAVTPSLGDDHLVKAFIIIIVGGLGSIPGAILGGFAIAAVESCAGFFFDLSTASITMFALVMVVLLVRPQGLLGHASR